MNLKTEVQPYIPLDEPRITRILRIEIGFIYNFSEVANGEKIQTKKIREIRVICGFSSPLQEFNFGFLVE